MAVVVGGSVYTGTSRVTASRATSWSVASNTGGTTRVIASRSTTWATAATLVATRITSWSVASNTGGTSRVVATRSTSWIVFPAAAGTGGGVGSGDGTLTAYVDAVHFGVLLKVTYAAAHCYVTVIRTNPDGSRNIVRSGDAASVYGGYAVVYDAEAPLGVPVSYTSILAPAGQSGPDAVGRLPGDPDWGVAPGRHVGGTYDAQTALGVIDRATAVGRLFTTPQSAPVSVVIPSPGISLLKVIGLPDLVVRARLAAPPTHGRGRASQTLRVLGRAEPAVIPQVRSTAQFPLNLYVDSSQVAAMRAVLQAGAVLLVQGAQVGYRDVYVSVTDDSERWTAPKLGYTDRFWDLTCVEVRRPGTASSRLRIPGRSFGAASGTVSSLSGSYLTNLTS